MIDLKNLSIKKIAPTTLLTILTFSPTISLHTIEAGNFESTGSTFGQSSESVVAIHKQTKSLKQDSLFRLTDWDYEEVGNQLILKKYKNSL